MSDLLNTIDTMNSFSQEIRKLNHIELAKASKISVAEKDSHFYYEPILKAHPQKNDSTKRKFLSKYLKNPFWISSMTGGVGPARSINQNLAKVCKEFGLGMGLGSCRVLLENDQYFDDFNLRPLLGDELPFYANLGIAQIEEINQSEIKYFKLLDMLKKLEVDGLIVHINPLQEWFQKEGDQISRSPIETLSKFCEKFTNNLIVKEVGQGMGPLSLKALLELPIKAIELSGFGGTNFTKLELLRNKTSYQNSKMPYVGHTAHEMVLFLNELSKKNKSYLDKEIIISGGIQSVLEGYQLMEKCLHSSIIGQAFNFLNHANSLEELINFTQQQIEEYNLCKTYLKLKSSEEYCD